MSQKQILNTVHAPAAIGPYNQAILAGNTLYVSGQIPLIPSSMELVTTGVADETHQVLKNISAILENAGYTFTDVVKVSIFISDMQDFGVINDIYDSISPKVSLPANVLL